jgi:hypothetical protein
VVLCSDMMKFFMMAIPVAVQILSPVVSKHGYSGDQAGCMSLVAELGQYKDDPEIKVLPRTSDPPGCAAARARAGAPPLPPAVTRRRARRPPPPPPPPLVLSGHAASLPSY